MEREEKARVLKERQLGFLVREERVEEERMSFRGFSKERSREISILFGAWEFGGRKWILRRGGRRIAL